MICPDYFDFPACPADAEDEIRNLRRKIQELEAKLALVVEAAADAANELYEVNMGNYDDDEVARLNNGSITASHILNKALQATEADVADYEQRKREEVVRECIEAMDNVSFLASTGGERRWLAVNALQALIQPQPQQEQGGE